jgi:hypothetical protein
MLAPVQTDRNFPGFDDGGAPGFDDGAHNNIDSREGARGDPKDTHFSEVRR